MTGFAAVGTSDYKIRLASTIFGTAFNFSQAAGTVDASYGYLTDSHASGGATWNAFTTNGNMDGGGNTGWNFTSALPATHAPIIFRPGLILKNEVNIK
jgi:hypothetical protein